jgi:hypothetical protein
MGGKQTFFLSNSDFDLDPYGNTEITSEILFSGTILFDASVLHNLLIMIFKIEILVDSKPPT